MVQAVAEAELDVPVVIGGHRARRRCPPPSSTPGWPPSSVPVHPPTKWWLRVHTAVTRSSTCPVSSDQLDDLLRGRGRRQPAGAGQTAVSGGAPRRSRVPSRRTGLPQCGEAPGWWGVTGAPGAGKSTIAGRLAAASGASRPAILAIDPSSPLTGGAILGDRIRMDNHVGHDAFIRSMATRGHAGGLAVAVPDAIRVLDAAGCDPHHCGDRGRRPGRGVHRRRRRYHRGCRHPGLGRCRSGQQGRVIGGGRYFRGEQGRPS